MSEVIFPAATVVVIRDNQGTLEVLMLRRSKNVKFASGVWVFPGGRIDAKDYGEESDSTEKAAYAAAIRETKEEAGITLDVDKLLYFSHWTAPPETSKRFATWFFITVVQGIEDVVIDGGEIDKYAWYTPQAAIDALNNKHIKMMPPTFVTLTQLSQCSSTYNAIAMYTNRVVAQFKPKVTDCDHTRCALYFGDAGYDTADPKEAGDARHRLWMLDAGWVYENNLIGEHAGLIR